MKKTLIGLATAALLMGPLAAFAVTVDVNGQPVQFDQAPVMMGGRVLVPLRGVFERLGASVQYNAATRSIQAQSGSTSIDLAVGSTVASINGQQQTLDQAPILVGGRAMVPLRFVSQALGANVTWDAGRQLVSISGTAPMGNTLPPSQSYNPPPAYNPPMAQAPVIGDIQLDHGRLRHRPLIPGRSLLVTMNGTPGDQATFDINGQTGFPMTEGPSGTYTGSYTVRSSDINNNAVVTVHLTSPNGQTASRNADETVVLGANAQMPPYGYPPGYNNGYVPPGYAYGNQLIRSVVHNGSGTLSFGQTLQVTMYGAPGARATFDVGSHVGLPMNEVSPGTYVGTYTVPLGDVNPNAQIIGHLTLPDGQTASQVAPPSIGLLGIPR